MSKRPQQLKKIPVAALRLGMHLQAFEGNWIDHPFWKTSFVLRDSTDLRKVLDSAVTACWIDTARGLDVREDDGRPTVAPRQPATPAQVARPREAASAGPGVAAPATPPPPQPSTDMATELRQAARLCQRSREAVHLMFAEARLGHALQAEHCLPLVDDITQSVFRNPGR